MVTILCSRCLSEGEALDKAPFRDAMGREIHENTCKACWKEWMEMQVKLINEMGLLPVNPEHAAILEKNLTAFLNLPSAEGDEVDEVGRPPA